MTADTINKLLSKNDIDLWFQDNYNELRKIVKGMAAKNNNLEHWSDLFSNAYLYALSNVYKNEEELRRVVIQYAKMQLQWSNSALKNEIKDKRWSAIPEGFDVEEKKDELEEKMKDEYEYQLKLGAILEYRQSLTKKEDIIFFDIYFSGDNTRTKLVQRFAKQNKKMSESTATRMLSTFRQKITDIYKKNGGTFGVFPNKKKK